MAFQTATPPDFRSRDLAGVASVLAGMAFFVGQDVLMKDLLGAFTVWTLMAVRGAVALMVLVPLIVILGGPHRLLTPLWALHFVRGVLFAIGFSLFYAAFPFMGLAEVSTIFFAAPLITALLAVLFLGERIGWRRVAALVVGFVGVVIAMAPDTGGLNWVAILPLLCAVFYAAGQVMARVIGDRETMLTTGLYTIVFSSLTVLPVGWMLNQAIPLSAEMPHLGWHFQEIEPRQFLKLGLLGAVGMVGYLLLTRAYQIAPASLVAPFDYSYLPMATLAALILWAEVPGTNTLAGMALIVASGLYLGYRELVQRRTPDAVPPTAEAVFMPGSAAAPAPEAPDALDR
ncbi:MAG: DMT family transporter [Pseudomonadota bacterium]